MIFSPRIFIASSTLILRTLIALSRSNWLLIWAAIELNLLRFIPILLRSKQNQEREAAIKYFLAQALGSSLLLFSRFSSWFQYLLIKDITYILLIRSVLLKLGRFPCHFWFPSVITSTRWISCLVLATWQKLAPLSILAIILTQLSRKLIVIVASINAIVGGIIGINQSHLRTILAYSSISHIGWIIRILTINASIYCILYYFIYVVLITPIFFILHKMSVSTLSTANKITDYPPLIQLSVVILLLSLAGLPPITGFLPKFIVLTILFRYNILLALILILGSLITLYFYLNIAISLIINSRIQKRITQRSAPSRILIISGTMSLILIPIIFLIYALTLLNKS